MLILSRRNRESVVVGGSGGFEQLLKVTVLGIRDGKVTLGFEVNENIPVHRLELWQRINAKKRVAERSVQRELVTCGAP